MKKKTFSIIIFSVAVAFLIIGIHQVMTVGWAHAYWIFMVTVACLLWYKMRTKDITDEEEKQTKASKNKPKRK